jgi:hypothetical protein
MSLDREREREREIRQVLVEGRSLEFCGGEISSSVSGKAFYCTDIRPIKLPIFILIYR